MLLSLGLATHYCSSWCVQCSINVFSMLSPLVIFWYQILLSTICLCIYFQVWIYFTWLHFLYRRCFCMRLELYIHTCSYFIYNATYCTYIQMHVCRYLPFAVISSIFTVTEREQHPIAPSRYNTGCTGPSLSPISYSCIVNLIEISEEQIRKNNKSNECLEL